MRSITCLAMAATWSLACTSVPTQTALMEQTELSVSTSELRIQVRSLARPFGGLLETSADLILKQTRDPAMRVNALRWKTSAVPALHSALFEPDPLAALFDTAALLYQMEFFLEGPGGVDVPEEALQVTLAAIEEMHTRLEDVATSVGASEEGIEIFWDAAREWAMENPIDWSVGERKTTHQVFARVISQDKSGLGATAGRMEESMADISARIDLYAEAMAKQARWQAELAFEDALARGVPKQVIDDIGPVAVDLNDLPIDIAAEREAVLAALAAERQLILDWIQDERLDTLDFVRLEREMVTALITAELESKIAILQGERTMILEAVTAEREAAAKDVERILAAAMLEIQKTLVDHLVNRVMLLIALVLPTIFAGLFVLVWYATRRIKG